MDKKTFVQNCVIHYSGKLQGQERIEAAIEYALSAWESLSARGYGDTRKVTENSAQKGTRLKLTQLPPEWGAWARGEGINNPESVFDGFRDYWIAQPGQKGVKLDWQATWRNWCRRDNGKAETPAKTGRMAASHKAFDDAPMSEDEKKREAELAEKQLAALKAKLSRGAAA